MPEDEKQYLHEVVITAIVYQGDRYLIMRRSPSTKRFPGMWTVPGGKLETEDYTSRPRETPEYWYNVLEHTLRREVREEVGIEITDIEYVTSLATIHADGNPSLVISCMAAYASCQVTLQPEECDEHAWVTLEEAKQYRLIDGIYDELLIASQRRKGLKGEWKPMS
ncbi:MAG: NUDIX domain-containing protein [Candidatus Sungbacteria bacterium]|nr:NUDIX domain-containing protein [Candidatus Sungbacteria bacterium]